MQSTIFILEDNNERIVAMRACILARFPTLAIAVTQSTSEAVNWLESNLLRAIAISLDHDLERPLDQPAVPDPGSGRDVADWLARHKPVCPIVIHSTNTHAALGMELCLQDAGWQVERITPYNDLEWVAAAWLPLVQRVISYPPRMNE
jgi:hypothetical protein